MSELQSIETGGEMMEPWMIDMRREYNRDVAWRKLARYTLALLALAVLVVWVAARCCG